MFRDVSLTFPYKKKIKKKFLKNFDASKLTISLSPKLNTPKSYIIKKKKIKETLVSLQKKKLKIF
jgi:hypothetical protein